MLSSQRLDTNRSEYILNFRGVSAFLIVILPQIEERTCVFSMKIVRLCKSSGVEHSYPYFSFLQTE